MGSEAPVSKITLLGSGTCVPSLSRSSCSILLETRGNRILFDAGAGTIRRLLEAGTTIFDISYIFLSHFHPDHSAEIVDRFRDFGFVYVTLDLAGLRSGSLLEVYHR